MTDYGEEEHEQQPWNELGVTDFENNNLTQTAFSTNSIFDNFLNRLSNSETDGMESHIAVSAADTTVSHNFNQNRLISFPGPENNTEHLTPFHSTHDIDSGENINISIPVEVFHMSTTLTNYINQFQTALFNCEVQFSKQVSAKQVAFQDQKKKTWENMIEFIIMNGNSPEERCSAIMIATFQRIVVDIILCKLFVFGLMY